MCLTETSSFDFLLVVYLKQVILLPVYGKSMFLYLNLTYYNFRSLTFNGYKNYKIIQIFDMKCESSE